MQRGEQCLLDADFAVEQIKDRDDGVGRARGGGDDALAAGQRLLVDAGDDGGIDVAGAEAGVREQQPRATGSEKTCQFRASTVAA